LTVLAIVSCRTRVTAANSYPPWQTVTCTILLLTGCIVKTLALSFTLRAKKTFFTCHLTVIPLKSWLTLAFSSELIAGSISGTVAVLGAV